MQPEDPSLGAVAEDEDGDLPAAAEAELNNQPKEGALGRKLRALVEGEQEWIHFDELYRTGITGNLRTR